MPALAYKKAVELNEKEHKLIFRPELPLINPETVFSHGTWQSILELVEDCLYSKDLWTYPSFFEMDLTINDLCFTKAYGEFDFKRAEKLFSQIGLIEYSKNSRGSTMLLIKEWDARLYSYRDVDRDVVNFVVGRSDESKASWIKGGHFIYEPTRWITTRKKFLEFIDIIEKALMGQGAPLMCRAFMNVKIPNGYINIQYLYQMPDRLDFDVKTQFWKRLANRQLDEYDRQKIKIIPPETTITIII